MRIVRIFFLILGLFQLTTAYSLGCRKLITSKIAVTVGLKNNDIVFLGDLISSDSIKLTYSFRILELFKGNSKSDTIYGKVTSQFSNFPSVAGLWLVYANFNKDSTIDINECGPTNSMTYPYYCNPPPPSVLQYANMNYYDKLGTQINRIDYYNEGIRNWFFDLEKLRSYKNSLNSKVLNQKIDFKMIFLIVSFALNVIMFLVIIIKIKK